MVKQSTNTQYSYIISGNGVQNGNPSPSNILPFDGCGDKTENLFDESTIQNGYYGALGSYSVFTADTKYRCFKLDLPAGTYTLNIMADEDMYILRCSNSVDGSITVYSAPPYTFTLSVDATIYVSWRNTNTTDSFTNMKVMLNVGSTALPYKPYGYKLNITSSGENLFDSTIYELVPASTTAQRKGINLGVLPQGSYTLNAVTSSPTQIYRTTKNGDTYTYETILTLPYTFTTDGISEQIIRTAGQSGNSWADIGYTNIMLNRGSIPLPYKPYIEPTKANIYLGQVQTTRNIKKLVLTGEENTWRITGTGRLAVEIPVNAIAGQYCFCTHYIGTNVTSVTQLNDTECEVGSLNPSNKQEFVIYDTQYTSITDFVPYLQQQYAAGTPVCVWYVLSEPETAVVNEPLMKIGNYVDTINNTQSGIPISTNNLVVNTTIPPSDISINTTATWVPINYNKYNTETISTIAPIDFLSSGQDITVRLKGNTEQLEIPSPDNPIMPQGTGERTGNLLPLTGWEFGQYRDGVWESVEGRMTSDWIVIESGKQYALTINQGQLLSWINLNYFDQNKQWLGNRVTLGMDPFSPTAQFIATPAFPTGAKYLRVVVRGYNESELPSLVKIVNSNVQVTEGSTFLPYQPYGCVINIINNTISNPVYLGEVQSTRRIRKLVLTGEEAWYSSSKYVGSMYAYFSQFPGIAKESPLYCSHLITADSISQYQRGTCTCDASSVNLWIFDTTTSPATFKSYLAQQYANGTPVTVWYVLAKPETGIVNEPLYKIGDYTDEISGITVPTTKGANTLSVNTPVQPSNVQVSISGWVPHDNVKKYKNNAWMATSWEGFRDIVRAGNGPTRYPIGTKLYETWGDDTSNAIIIAGYNDFFDPDITAQGYTNSVTLISEKFIPSMSFDAVEAMMYVTTEMPPGTYKFTIPNYDASYGGNKTYYFETTEAVPVGGHICLEWRYQTIPRTIRTYASATSTTVLDSYGTQANPLPEWDSSVTATDLGAVSMGTTVTTGTYGIFNHIHRVRYGSNNYYQSKLRQYMNSGASAGNWWKPMTIFDRPMDFYNIGPNPVSVAGYLSTVNSDFKSVLAAPSIPCMTNNTFEVGTIAGTPFARQTAYNVRDKVFLLSHTEVNLSSSPTVGSTLALYTNATDADRIKYNKNAGNAGNWWLRVPYPSNASHFRYVTSSGALNYFNASNSYGLVPAYTIQ